MTSVPIMPLDVDKLLSDKKMQRLMRGGEAKAFWEWTLTQMWANKSWLPCDDAIISDMLDIDVRRWRNRYKPIFEQLLVREVDPHVGDIYRHPKLTEVWDRVAKRINETHEGLARARAEKAAKAKREASVAEPKNPPATEPATAPAPEPVTGLNKNLEKKGAVAAPSKAGSPPLSGDRPFEVPALPPMPKSEADGSAAVGSPGLEGRSPPQPSERVPAPTPALLRSKLVKNGGKHDPEPPDDPDRGGDDDDQGELPEPSRARRGDAGAVGLFGALEAAIRRGKGGEGET